MINQSMDESDMDQGWRNPETLEKGPNSALTLWRESSLIRKTADGIAGLGQLGYLDGR